MRTQIYDVRVYSCEKKHNTGVLKCM